MSYPGPIHFQADLIRTDGTFKQSFSSSSIWFGQISWPEVGLGKEFRSEKIPRNRLGTVSVIPRKKVLIPKHSEFQGRDNFEARNGTERDGIPRKK
jgi:hypothetical protein